MSESELKKELASRQMEHISFHCVILYSVALSFSCLQHQQ